MRRLRSTVFCGGIISTMCACSGAPEDGETRSLVRQREQALDAVVVTESQLNEHAVLGVERVVGPDGAVVEERIVDTGNYPENVQELVESGQRDSEGHRYAMTTGARSDGDVTLRFQYIQRVQTRPRSMDITNLPRPAGTRAVPANKGKGQVLGAALRDRIALGDPDEYVSIQIKRLGNLATSLRRPHAGLKFAALRSAQEESQAHRQRIAARKEEVASKYDDLISELETLGASSVSTLWLTGRVAAEVPLGAVSRIAADSSIEAIELDEQEVTPDAAKWTGRDIKHVDGLLANLYVNDGYHGEQSGSPIRIAVMDTGGFYEGHPGFTDSWQQISRVSTTWNCAPDPCTEGQEADSDHGTAVAGLAAGDLRDNQIRYQTDMWKRDRTGVCEECELLLLKYAGLIAASAERALEKAVEWGADIMVNSTGAGGVVCDGDWGVLGQDNFDEAVYQAYESGMLFINSAGNDGHSDNCNLEGPAESPAAFVVGGVGDNTAECDAHTDAYKSCGDYDWTSLGGMNIVVDGYEISGQISQVDAVAPACPYYTFNRSGWFTGADGQCGTSYAAPQVAGSAALLKDWYLDTQSGEINTPGYLYTMLLGFTDRGDTSSYRNAGFSPQWGGGRFQLRYLDSVDEPCGAFGWDLMDFNVEDGDDDIIQPMNGTGAEPIGINHFKSYITWFEKDIKRSVNPDTDSADIILQAQPNNCSGGSLMIDWSYDIKKMVHASSGISGQKLCTRIIPYHVPDPWLENDEDGVRNVVLFQYYSTCLDFR